MRIDKDPDFHNQRLWKRKKHRQQKDKDERKKQFKQFKQIQATSDEIPVEDKQKAFYDSLFVKDDLYNTAANKKKKVKKIKTDPQLKGT